jgi:hypothetical protein
MKHNLKFHSNKNAFFEILVHSLTDSGLQERHGLLYKITLITKRLDLLGLAKLVSGNFQPVIDMTVIKVKP